VAIGRALSAPDASTARKGSTQRVRARLPAHTLLHSKPLSPHRARCIRQQPLLAAAACIAACAVAFRVVGPASRRAANAPYALWVLAHNAVLLAASAVADAAMPGRMPLLVERLSAKHAMLGTFLVANLMTVRSPARIITSACACLPACVRACVLQPAHACERRRGR